MSRKFFFQISLIVFVINQSKSLIHGDVVAPTIHPISLNSSVPEEYKKLPLVGKCCPLGEILILNDNHKAFCSTINSTGSLSRNNVFSPLFSEFNETGFEAPGDRQTLFAAYIGDPCDYNRYMLEPRESLEDEHYLLRNGSIFAPYEKPALLSPGVNYCMDILENVGLKTIVCSKKDEIEDTPDYRLIIYACGLLISVPFLLLTIVAYCIAPILRDAHGKALCNYCGCLIVAFSTLALAQLASEHISNEVCVSIAFIIQFSFVACFFWLNVMCIETWLLIHRRVHRDQCYWEPKKLFFYYSIWGWVPPALLILISMIMDLNPTVPSTYVKPNFGSQSCWFKSDKEAMPYFYIPVGVLIVMNLIFFALTARDVNSYQRELDLRLLARNQESDRREQKMIRRTKKTLFVSIGLFFIMGMNWAMEMISWWSGGDPLAWSAFDMVNALQGIIIFGLFVLRRPIQDIVWYRIQYLRGVPVDEPEILNIDLRMLPLSDIDETDNNQTA